MWKLFANRRMHSRKPPLRSTINLFKLPTSSFLGVLTTKKAALAPRRNFPRPVALNFLTRVYARDPKSESGKHALEMDLLTLRKMAAGGMHDHLGGGFHRYSVDRYWHVPHFEKMLYDQAQLATAYLDAFQILGDPHLIPLPGQGEEVAKRQVRVEFESVVRDILDYIARDMTSKDGGFFSAEDADSPDPVAAVYDRRDESVKSSEVGAHRAPLQKSEGAFYVWTEKQIDAALGDDSAVFKFHYGVQGARQRARRERSAG